MKKILLALLLLTGLGAAAQIPGYTRINSRYDWLAGRFSALTLPAYGDTAFQTGQWHGAGAVLVDTVGDNKGLYVWYDAKWNKVGAGEGLLFARTDPRNATTDDMYFSNAGKNFVIDSLDNISFKDINGIEYFIANPDDVRIYNPVSGGARWHGWSADSLKSVGLPSATDTTNMSFIGVTATGGYQIFRAGAIGAGSSYTFNNGITNTAGVIKLGEDTTSFGSTVPFITPRLIDVAKKGIWFTGNQNMPATSASKQPYFNFYARDTISANNSTNVNYAATIFNRELYMNTTRKDYLGSHFFGTKYLMIVDSTHLYSVGGDFGEAFKVSREVNRPSTNTNRTVLMGGANAFDANPGIISWTYLGRPNGQSTGSRMRGWWAGLSSYPIIQAAGDTLDNWIDFHANSTGMTQNLSAKMFKKFSFYSDAKPATVDSAWHDFNAGPTVRSYFGGSVAFGGGNTGPTEAVEVIGNIKHYNNPLNLTAATTMLVWDSVSKIYGHAPIPSAGSSLTMAAIGSSPNANGATIAAGVLTLQPANASNGGVIANATQTIPGAKTFPAALTASTSVITPLVTTASTELKLSQTGDTFGESGIRLMNRSGSAGAAFYNVGLDLVDLAFISNSSNQFNFRYEHRSGSLKSAGNTTGEFQMLGGSGINIRYSFGEASAWMGLPVGYGTVTTPVSTVDIGGSMGAAIATVTGNTTLNATHYTVLVDATAGNVTITLPTATSASRRIYIVKKIDASANTVTIDGNGSEVIDGATTQVLLTQWSSFQIQSNATSWYIL